MKQYNLARLIAEVKSSLISYLASALPVGNHHHQRALGERFLSHWTEQTFKGPFIETMPQYEAGPSLCDLFSDRSHASVPDELFWSRMRPTSQWADVEKGLRLYLGVRNRLWPLGSSSAESEAHCNALEQLWTRPLYRHQLASFERVSRLSKSTVIATGTGSGKTECFLIPLLYGLLTEPDAIRSQNGVRALLLYPMNALVEDQMSRLRRLLFWVNLKCKESGKSNLVRPVTFGRYTGQTPVGQSDRREERSVSPEEVHELGELRFRDEMQASPPDILVTNFTMLEYMLLRNDDRQLFRGPVPLTFLVLDEVHTYGGTKGMEVATLLRRLEDYLARTQRSGKRFVAVGASATLGTETNALDKMAKFASNLFGREFKEDDIITGTMRVHQQMSVRPAEGESGRKELTKLKILAPTLCRAYSLTQSDGDEAEIPDDDWRQLASVLLVRTSVFEGPLARGEERNEVLAEILKGSPTFQRLLEALANSQYGVLGIESLATAVFGDAADKEESLEGISILLQLGLAARNSGAPLVTVRAHLFVKEHRQAQLCLCPRAHSSHNDDGWWSELFVVHRERCNECDSVLYPVLLCRKCGFVLLQAWHRQNRLYPEKDELLGLSQFKRRLLRPLAGVTERMRDRLEKPTL